MFETWHWFTSGTALKKLDGATKTRSVGDELDQQRKDELGHGPFEGRSWRCRRCHALVSIIAFGFLHACPFDADRRN
jgi:SRSO17 transposase